jgi:cytoskeletal protein RodZ
MESPGCMIQRAREAAGLTLTELARVTRIPRASLQQIENDNFEPFTAEVFVRGFLRNIARELKLDPAQVIAAYEEHTGRKHRPHVTAQEVQEDPSSPRIAATAALRTSPDRPRRSRMPSFDHMVEVVGSTRPSYVIGTLLVLLGIALAISVITNGLDYDQRLSFHDAPATRASWDVPLDGKATRAPLHRPGNLVGTTTLDLIRDDASPRRVTE